MGGSPSRLDDLARDLASGTISRRTALRRLAAGALGIGLAATPSALAEELERGNCPKSRRCGNKCCPKGAKCQNGKCKCKAGRVKCGKKCCAPGESCEGGQCVPSCECTGSGGGCGPAEFCASPTGQCDACAGCEPRPQSCPDIFDPVCGCDGVTYPNACEASAAGVSIASEGACLEGCGDRACGQAPNGDDCGVCEAGLTCMDDGSCVCVPSCPEGTCGPDDGCGGTCTCPSGFVCQGGFCTGTGQEFCNNLDDDADGQVDETFPDKGQPCECAPGVPGIKVCRADGLGTECMCTG